MATDEDLKASDFFNEELKKMWSLEGIRIWWRHYFQIPQTDDRYLNSTDEQMFEDHWNWLLLTSDVKPVYDKESLEQWVRGAVDLNIEGESDGT